AFGPPWQRSQAEPRRQNSRSEVADGYEALQRAVPEDACLGAVLDVWEPSFLLYGHHFGRRVVYLSRNAAYDSAAPAGVNRVIVTTGEAASVIDAFSLNGWKVESLGDFWKLATDPRRAGRDCGEARG